MREKPRESVFSHTVSRRAISRSKVKPCKSWWWWHDDDDDDEDDGGGGGDDEIKSHLVILCVHNRQEASSRTSNDQRLSQQW